MGKWNPKRIAGLFIAFFLVATVGTMASASPSRGYGVQRGQSVVQQRSSVPWAKVGPGWFLVSWVNPRDASYALTVYLVSPKGVHYTLLSYRKSQGASLAAWSYRRRAAVIKSTHGIQDVNLVNGKVLHHFDRFPGNPPNYLAYTQPDNLGLLTATVNTHQTPMRRLTLNGKVENRFPDCFECYTGPFLQTPDGSQIARGTFVGYGPDGKAYLAMFTPRGKMIRDLFVRHTDDCDPERMWGTKDMLATCNTGNGTINNPGNGLPNRLWEVPLSGAAPKALTTQLRDNVLTAWRLPTGLFVQARYNSKHFKHFVARETNLHRLVRVPLRGVKRVQKTLGLGTYGKDIGILVTSGDIPTEVLLYDTAKRTVQPIAEGLTKGGHVGEAYMYDGTPASQ